MLKHIHIFSLCLIFACAPAHAQIYLKKDTAKAPAKTSNPTQLPKLTPEMQRQKKLYDEQLEKFKRGELTEDDHHHSHDDDHGHSHSHDQGDSHDHSHNGEAGQADLSGAALQNAKRVANACVPGAWKTQNCLKTLSENNLVMASNYGAALQKAGKRSQAEKVKKKCAASTAASRGEYPADAMRSAFVECVNEVPEVAKSTQILPDESQFQLLVAAIQCLDGQTSCPMIEKLLAQYKN